MFAENVSLKQKGAKFVLSQEIPDEELDSKDILGAIRVNQSEIDKLTNQLKQMHENIPRIEEAIQKNSEMLKKLKHFEIFALEIQNSKVKTIIDEVFEECRVKVDAEYKYDPVLTAEQNDLQKFKLLEMKIGTHPRIASEIDKDVMSKACFTEPIFKNPYLRI